MRREKANYSISVLCRVLRVSRSGYYDWKDREPSKKSQQDTALTPRRSEKSISEAAKLTVLLRGYTLSYIQAMGISCGRNRVARLMRKAGLRGCLRGRRRRKGTTLRDGAASPAADLLRRDFSAL
jgi:putative transposase